MPTDRSLWVEDKYALRCRGCGEKFTMFRRRHHCRRCGQVFCYECLYSAPSSAASQSIIDNFYEWFAPSPTRMAHNSLDPVTTAAATVTSTASSPVPVQSVVTVGEEVQAALSTRLCRRCAATILENAEREASPTSRLEFRPSSNNNNSSNSNSNSGSLQQLASFSSPAPVAVASSLSASLSRAITPPRRPLAAPLSDTSPLSPMAASAAATPLSQPDTSQQIQLAKRKDVYSSPYFGCSKHEHDETEAAAASTEGDESWRAARHDETAEQREVTYSIGRVQRRVPTTMQEWWIAHQATMQAKEQRNLSASVEKDRTLFGLTTSEAIVHVLTDPITFAAGFCVKHPGSSSASGGDEHNDKNWACAGSAASHAETDLTDVEAVFLDTYSRACTAHLLSRTRRAVEASLPTRSANHLSKHLAAIAWHVVQHTVVALGTTIDEHVALFSVPSPALPPQCLVYPGLICAQRLPSKRAMTACERPRVLLLAGHLSYPVQPAEDLVDYVRSYSGYLDKLHQRLAVWNPDVVVVEGGLHHYLRERIEAEGRMRLLLHVGRDFLVQLAWCLHADIIADLQYVGVADLATTAPMGTCARFEVLELAEEQLFCAFTGFAGSSCFHTLVFCGANVASSRNGSGGGGEAGEKRRSVRPPSPPSAPQQQQQQWSILEQLGREAVTAAYHAAMQSHWLSMLLHFSSADSAFAAEVAAAVTTTVQNAASTSCLTLNCGCQFPPTVLSACQSAGADASLVRDTLVLNVVIMDHLFENGCSNSGGGGGGTGGFKTAMGTAGLTSSSSVGAGAATAAVNVANVVATLTRVRSSETVMDALLSSPASRPSSVGASRTDLPGLLSGGLGGSGTTHTRADSAASAYAVVQQKAALTFYGSGDDSLYAFLISRCSSSESQLLYLHGGHRVRVQVTRAAPRTSVTQGNSNNNGGLPSEVPSAGSCVAACAALEEAQKAAFRLAAMRQSVARTLGVRGGESMDATAVNAWLTFLHGFFSLHISSEAAGREAGGGDTPAPTASASPPFVDVTVPTCSPHLLNYSTAAFLEWVLYGWMPPLLTSSSSSSSSSSPPSQQHHRLRLVFSFHANVALAGGSVGVGSGAAPPIFKDTVTLLVDPIPLLQIQYPPPVLPSPPTFCVSAELARDVSTTDLWYAAFDADEFEKMVGGFCASLTAVLEGSASCVTSSAKPSETAHSAPQQQQQSQPSSSSLPLSPVQADKHVATLRQLCDRAQLAVEALRESRARGTEEVALVLRSLRRHLIPALLADYRAWQLEARRAPLTKSVAPAHDGGADPVGVTALLSGSVERGALCSCEDCYFHPERTQWVRLSEPASVLAAALDLLYGGVSSTSLPSPPNPVTATDSRAFPHLASLPAKPSSPRVSFAVPAEAYPVPHPRSSVVASAYASPSGPLTPHDRQLLFTPRLTRAEALDVLQQCGKAEGSHPASVICSLGGYKPVLPTGGRAGGGSVVSTVGALVEASATSASALMGLGGGGGGIGGAAGSSSGTTNNSNASGNNTNGGSSLSESAGELKLTVEVLFPHAFAALHVLYTDGAPLNFCATLLRSKPFMTEGGKSQSRFFVTEDGRFLVKCVKQMELRHFKEWAPQYFARMAAYYAASPSSQSPCCEQSTLGKVLGLYVVHVQGSRISRSTAPTTSGDSSGAQQSSPQLQTQTLRNLLPDGVHCFMVAEQLLFRRPVRETWDLKGSQRNRTTEQTAAVRLDVDLVQERLRHGDFFFCAPEAKRLLMDYLSRDTQLLSEGGIMDYSLMASVGSGNLYVGMIDYLHPYSSAKVLESKMKSGLDTVFGYGRRDPTIIDPPSYAARFMLWMDGYVNGVPDRLFPLTRVRLLEERKEGSVVPANDAAKRIGSSAAAPQ